MQTCHEESENDGIAIYDIPKGQQSDVIGWIADFLHHWTLQQYGLIDRRMGWSIGCHFNDILVDELNYNAAD